MGDSPTNCVYVGKLDYKASEQDLRGIFGQFGTVEEGMYIWMI